MNQIVVRQNQPEIIVQQNPYEIIVEQEQVQVIVQQAAQIVVQQTMPQIIVQGGNFVVSILPFTFTASATGQTTFGPLPSSPTAMICLFITGAGQNQAGGDYSMNGEYIVLSQGVNKGDTIYGAYEV